MYHTSNRIILGTFILLLITFLVYVPAMRSGFIWDDDKFLTQNSLIKAKDGPYRFWFTTEAPDYFPLTSTSLWLEWRLWGENASGYHAVNVLLHALSSVLLWRILKRLKVPGAWLSGVIFAVHPVNVESVAWITERKNTLSVLFYVLSILLYLQFDSVGRRWIYGLSLGAFFLALLSKTAVVMQPFVLLGCAWWQRKRLSRDDIIRVLPFFFLSGILSLVTIFFQYHRAIGEGIVRTDGALSRLAIAGWAVWFYLYKAILPYGLSFVYPRWELEALSLSAFVPGMLLVALFILFWFYRRTWGRPFLFGLGCYVVMLFPVLGFFNIYFMRFSLVADHWQYASIMGLIALVVGLGTYAYKDFQKKFRYVSMAAVVVLVLGFSFLTWRQGYIYKDVETLWSHTIAKNPECWMAHNNLGYAMAGMGRTGEAIEHYRAAVQARPDLEEVYYNLANALADQGRLDEAIRNYYQALRLNPDFMKVHVNLANALAAQGKLDEAIPHYHKALRQSPHLYEAHYNLGKALAAQGKLDEAITHYEEALGMNPDFGQAHYNLANALAAQGKLREAIRHYSKCLQIRPHSVGARLGLGNALTAQGKLDEAIRHYRDALRLMPDSVEAHTNLGAALVQKARIDEAVSHFQKALRIQPDNVNAQKNLKTALTLQQNQRDPIKIIQDALRAHPNNPELYYKLGVLLQEEGQLDQAIEHYKQAISIQPGFFEALDKLALAYVLKMEYDQALALFKKMIGIRPYASSTYYNIACIYAKQNRIGASVEWLKQAVSRGYNNWDLIKKDKDLENIRGSRDYEEIMEGH